MVIHINPDRIGLSGSAGKAAARKRNLAPEGDDAVVVPSRAYINHIPAPEALRTLISGAVEALRRGVRWDRGTILNLLV